MSGENERTISRLRSFTESLEKESSERNYSCKKITLNLKPQPFTADRVRHARSVLRLTQSVFAELIGVSVRTVQDWEQGRNRPENAACRLMDEIIHDPDYWKARVKDSAEVVA